MNSRFETFAFLPPMSNTQAEAQVHHMLQQGCIPAVEFYENPNTADFYWQRWPLQAVRVDATGRQAPLTASQIITQAESCAQRHPYAHIRISGYSPTTRQTEAAFIYRTPQEGQ